MGHGEKSPTETTGGGGDVGAEMDKRPAPKAYGAHPHKVEWGPNTFTLYTDLNNPFYYRTPKDKKNIELPFHVPQNPMSLEVHLRDPRQRVFMTEAEREWRRKWWKDQNLHADEPFYVSEVQFYMNPIRRIYRYPLDLLAEKFLYPKLSPYYGQKIRQWTPRWFFTIVGSWLVWEYFKYNKKSWDNQMRPTYHGFRPSLGRRDEIEAKHPGLIEIAFPPERNEKDFLDLGYAKREVFRNVGPTVRPW